MKIYKSRRIFIFLFFILLISIFFVSSSNPFASLTSNQKILLAASYYKVALYYYDKGDTQKGDEFKNVARYLDPNFQSREIDLSFTNKLTDEQIEQKVKESRDNADKVIERFFKDSSQRLAILSYPVYNLNSSDLYSKENIDTLLAMEPINSLFSKDIKIIPTTYEKASQLSSFLPLVYLPEDLIFIVTDADNQELLVVLERQFGLNIKIIGFLPIIEKTVVK